MTNRRNQYFARRQFLRGAAGVVVGLPLLESFASRRAQAGIPIAPKRLVIMVHQQGTLLENGSDDNDAWTPRGSGSDYTLSPILAPLEAMRNKIAPVSGLWDSGGRSGHESCGKSVLTAMPSNPGAAPQGPSLDQVIGDRIAQDAALPRRTLNLALTTGRSTTFDSETQILWDTTGSPVPSETDPVELFARVFSGFNDPGPGELTIADNLRASRSSVLDTIAADLARMQTTVSQEDAIRLEAHAENIRRLERELSGVDASPLEACNPTAPTLDENWDRDRAANEHLATTAMIDQAVMALACDQTRVATIHFQNSQAPTFPWLDVQVPWNGEEWHTMVHESRLDDGARQALQAGFTWYTEQFAYLLQQMDQFVEPDGRTLLDNSLVLWTSDFGDGNEHSASRLPIVLAGGLSGAVPMGRHIAFTGAPGRLDISSADAARGSKTGQLFTTIQNLFDIDGNWNALAEYGPLDLA